MKSVPVLELHRGKPAPAPVKCIRRAIGSTQVPSLEHLKEKQLGIAQPDVFIEWKGDMDLYLMAKHAAKHICPSM